MSQIVLAQGPPTLTADAADAALDAIDFIAAAVRGYDAIDVTSVVRPIWRAHLAYWYPQLPPQTRLWYANAPEMLASIRMSWPLLDPYRRQMLLQQWSMELPYMLWMVDPVLAEAENETMELAQQQQLAYLRQQAQQAQPAAVDPQVQAAQMMARKSAMTASFESYSTAMTNSTINLMRAINRR
jgi:hypothetical protein